ncbi:MFS transporter [Rarobacter faecitabidus]|uniref:DHA1 family inner membrane transport protein n=1 Tax=Rarobacter faecitabidus TaxID=13243 RepID=A0A542ZUW3_RARFA|nr:MFS transporter [Rarobacter faecitabidus]TQL64153.1 DHA1 family inner membrane transport protein [Rarobacter faecitabidus]
MSNPFTTSIARHPGLALLALAIGGFTIGTTEFAAMGVLTNVGEAFGVNDATAGHTISAYAIGVVLGGPLLTVTSARMPRKTLLIALMALYTFGNLLSSFAPNLELLIAGRLITGLAHGVFFGVGAVVGTAVVGVARSGFAVSMMLVGLTIANIVGVPLSSIVGDKLGWEWTFRLVALLGVATILGVWWFIPPVAPLPGASPKSEFAALKNGPMWLAMAAGAIGFGGMFAAYSYVKPIVLKGVGAGSIAVSLALAAFGLGMTVGVLLGGRLSDRSVNGTTNLGFITTAISLAVFAFIMGTMPGVLIGLFLVGVASQILGVSLQAALMDLSPGAPSLGASLCHSSLNLGNANGAFLGGLVLTSGLGYPALAWLGVILTVFGLGLMLIVQRLRVPQRILEAAAPGTSGAAAVEGEK